MMSGGSEVEIGSAFADSVDRIKNGSSIDAEAERLYAQMTDEERLWILSGDRPFWDGMRGWLSEGYNVEPYSMGKVERLGIPGIQFVDGPRGAVAGDGTAFPVSMARGATWDAELEERVGTAIGRELREQGGNFFGGVCINLPWHPGWGRSQETYSDQPMLLGVLGSALAKGIQKNAMACVKHYALNNMENGRFSVNAVIDDETFHEVYLPHFRQVIESGALAVMGAYNSVNGEWAGQNAELLTEILRDQWGFKGVTITDFIWGFRDPIQSLEAGMDVEAPFYQQRAVALAPALSSGQLQWEVVKKAVLHTLYAQLSIYSTREPFAPDAILSEEHLRLAREVATRAPVLLKNAVVDNRPVFPIRRETERIALIGGLASLANTGDYGSSNVRSPEVITIRQGLEDKFGSAVKYDDGSDLERAAELAGEADICIVVAGFTAAEEGEYLDASLVMAPEIQATHAPVESDQDRADEEFVTGKLSPGKSILGVDEVGGDREDLHLKESDVRLIEKMAAANPNTAVLLVHAGAVLMDPWHDNVPAIVSVWYNGCQGGAAIADLVAGDANFSGRMPYAVAKDAGDVPDWDINAKEVVLDRDFGHRLIIQRGSEPLFPLGWGLSYTNWRIKDASLIASKSPLSTGTVSVSLKNDGEHDGIHVIQIYASRRGFNNGLPELVGFRPVNVQAGASARVDVDYDLGPIRKFDSSGRRFMEIEEEVELQVGSYLGDAQRVLVVPV